VLPSETAPDLGRLPFVPAADPGAPLDDLSARAELLCSVGHGREPSTSSNNLEVASRSRHAGTPAKGGSLPRSRLQFEEEGSCDCQPG
jgi:hypothetical protein